VAKKKAKCSGLYVIVRRMPDGTTKYGAGGGEDGAFTADIRNAQVYDGFDSARSELLYDGESVMPLASQFAHWPENLK